MSRSIKGITIKIGAETTGLDKALKGVNDQAYAIQSELKKVNTLLKFSPDSTTLITQKQKLMADQVQTTREKLDALKEAEKGVQEQVAKGEVSEEQYRAFQREIVETESKLKHYEGQVKELALEHGKLEDTVLSNTEKFEKLGTKIGETGEKMTKAGKKFLPASAIATGALGGMAKSAIDFDTAFIGVQKTMADDITPQQLDDIKEGLKQLSKETGITTTELAGVAESAGQLGIETENILSFTKVMSDLGVATNLTADEASTMLARFANVSGMAQDDFDKLGATIVQLGNNFATTEKEIAEMALNLGSAGSQVGMTESDILALSTALSSVGLEASAGGTAFSKLMINMQLAVETGSEDMNDFARVAGMTADEFSKAFKEDATGAIEAFIKGLGEMDGESESAIKTLDDMGIKEVRLRDALLRSANASDIFSSAIEMGSEAWEENSALTEEADLRYNSVAGKMEKMKASLNVLAIELGDVFLPILTSVFEWITKLLDKFGNMSPVMQKVVVAVLAIVASIAPLLIFFGKLATGVSAIMKHTALFTKALTALKAGLAFLLTPMGAVVAGIVAIIAVAVLLYKNWDKVKEVTINVWNAIKDFFIGFWKWLKGFFEPWGDVINTILAGFMDIPNKVGEIWQSFKTKIVDIWNGVIAFFTETIPQFVSDVITWFKEMPAKVGESLSTFFTETLPFMIGEGLGNMVRIILETGSKIIENVKTFVFTTIPALIQTLKENIVNKFNEIKTRAIEILTGLWDTLVWLFTEMPKIVMNAIITFGSNIWKKFIEIKNNVVNTVKQLFNDVVAWFVALPGKILGLAGQFKTVAGTLATNLWNGLKNGITGIPGMVKDIFLNAISSVTNLASNAWNGATSFASNLWGGFKKGLGINSPSYIEEALFDITDTTDGMVKGMRKNFGKLATMPGKEAWVGTSSNTTNNTSSNQSSTANYNAPLINVASMSVRSDEDVRKVSRNLYDLMATNSRAQGNIIS